MPSAVSRDSATQFRNERYSLLIETLNIRKFSKGKLCEFSELGMTMGKKACGWKDATAWNISFTQSYLLSWETGLTQERRKKLCLAVTNTTKHFVTNKRALKIWNRSSLFKTPRNPWNSTFVLCASNEIRRLFYLIVCARCKAICHFKRKAKFLRKRVAVLEKLNRIWKWQLKASLFEPVN
jgi:hypothetical protein